MRSLLFAIMVPLLLAACASRQPEIIEAPPPGISYRIENGNVSATNRQADQYCQEHGKRAHLESIDRSRADPLAVYRCR
jgi:putative hemolysin